MRPSSGHNWRVTSAAAKKLRPPRSHRRRPWDCTHRGDWSCHRGRHNLPAPREGFMTWSSLIGKYRLWSSHHHEIHSNGHMNHYLCWDEHPPIWDVGRLWFILFHQIRWNHTKEVKLAVLGRLAIWFVCAFKASALLPKVVFACSHSKKKTYWNCRIRLPDMTPQH